MRLIIESNKINSSPSFQEFIEDLFGKQESYSVNKDEIIEYLSDNESDAFWDCLYELYPEGEPISKIRCKDAEATFISKTKENIESNCDDYKITLNLINNSDEVIETIIIDGADILLEFLEDESSCSEFYAKISGYVEKSFELFVDKSFWHFGYTKSDGTVVEILSATSYTGDFNDEKPIVWFGLADEKPEEIWTIKYDQLLADAWFNDDQWSLMEYLIEDCNDCFGVWYLAECGRCLPDMEEILKACPIKFEMTDTVEIINQKFHQFFK